MANANLSKISISGKNRSISYDIVAVSATSAGSALYATSAGYAEEINQNLLKNLPWSALNAKTIPSGGMYDKPVVLVTNKAVKSYIDKEYPTVSAISSIGQLNNEFSAYLTEGKVVYQAFNLMKHLLDTHESKMASINTSGHISSADYNKMQHILSPYVENHILNLDEYL